MSDMGINAAAAQILAQLGAGGSSPGALGPGPAPIAALGSGVRALGPGPVARPMGPPRASAIPTTASRVASGATLGATAASAASAGRAALPAAEAAIESAAPRVGSQLFGRLASTLPKSAVGRAGVGALAGGLAAQGVTALTPGNGVVDQFLTGAATGAGLGAFGGGWGAAIGAGIGGLGNALYHFINPSTPSPAAPKSSTAPARPADPMAKITAALDAANLSPQDRAQILATHGVISKFLPADQVETQIGEMILGKMQQQQLGGPGGVGGVGGAGPAPYPGPSTQDILASQQVAGQYLNPYADNLNVISQAQMDYTNQVAPSLPKEFQAVARLAATAQQTDAAKLSAAYAAQGQATISIAAMAAERARQQQMNNIAWQQTLSNPGNSQSPAGFFPSVLPPPGAASGSSLQDMLAGMGQSPLPSPSR